MAFGWLRGAAWGAARESKDNWRLALSVETYNVIQRVKITLADWTTVELPYEAFPASGDGTAPDFDKPSIIDWGSTVRFGLYEADIETLINDPQVVIMKEREGSKDDLRKI